MNILLESDVLKKDPKLFYKLADKIMGIIYKLDEKEWFDLFLPLAKEIQKIAKDEDFINHGDKKLEDYTFDDLVDYIKDLLEQLIFRKRNFNFDEIDKNLAKFEKLNEVVKSKLGTLQKDKRYSPMFWLCSWQRDKELKQAYLQEIENFIDVSQKIPNERNSDDNIWSLLSNLKNEDGFWKIFSEIIFANKFIQNKGGFNPVLEPQIPNKDSKSDLSIKLNNKKMFFEITNPETNRNVHIDNGAVTVRNKLDDVIRKKSRQFFSKETFDQIKNKKRDDLFFIVVDSSSSMIDEYMIQDSFYGSLAVEFYRHNETGETTEPRTIRKDNAVIKNKEFITGLIYFKRQLVNIDGKIRFMLIGDVIKNPDAINEMTVKDYKKLKKIIFGKQTQTLKTQKSP